MVYTVIQLDQKNMQSERLKDIAIATLEDMKGIEIQVMDVRGLTDITDYMVVVSGTSDRHVKALADKVLNTLREHEIRPLGVEGKEKSPWVLIDFGDVILHVMHPKARAFYDLEGLWGEHAKEMVLAQREHQKE